MPKKAISPQSVLSATVSSDGNQPINSHTDTVFRINFGLDLHKLSPPQDVSVTSHDLFQTDFGHSQKLKQYPAQDELTISDRSESEDSTDTEEHASVFASKKPMPVIIRKPQVKPKKRMSKPLVNSDAARECVSCHVRDTPIWRDVKGQFGKEIDDATPTMLCNACGL